MAGRAGTVFPIETERLLLRPFGSDDVAEIHAIYAEEWPYFRGPLSAWIDGTRKIVEVASRLVPTARGGCSVVPLAVRASS